MTAVPLTPQPLPAVRRAVLVRRIRWIVAATIGYNVVEAIVALTAGTVASSAALIAFGLDSIVEVVSAAAVAWQFAAPHPERRERVTLRLIAVSFFGLAAFVTFDAVRSLLGFADPQHSPVGLVLAAVNAAPVESSARRPPSPTRSRRSSAPGSRRRSSWASP